MKIQIIRSDKYIKQLIKSSGVIHPNLVFATVDPNKLSSSSQEAILTCHHRFPDVLRNLMFKYGKPASEGLYNKFQVDCEPSDVTEEMIDSLIEQMLIEEHKSYGGYRV